MAPTKTRGRKNVYRKKYKKRYHKRKQLAAANKNMVMYSVPNQAPYPPRYICRMTYMFNGYIASPTASGHYFIRMNSAYLPGATGGWLNSAPAIATLAPAGYSNIINANLYQSVRVFASKIELNFIPESLLDNVMVTITPSGHITAATPATTAVALEQRFTKSKFFSSSKPIGRDDSLKSTMTQHKFLGVRHQAIKDDLSGNYTHLYNTNPNQPLFWVVNWAPADAGALNQNMQYSVKVTYWLECWDQIGATLLEV